MSRVAGEEKRAGLHRLGDETAHLGDSLLDDGATIEFPGVAGCES